MRKPLFLVLAFAFFLALPSTRTYAQTVVAAGQTAAAPDPLFKTVESLDTQLFDAYNHCDLATLGSLVSEDLEFYHDKTGLAIGRQVFVDAIKNNICGKVTRELVPGTLEVYPIADYGAVEIGVHRFYHPGEPGNVGEAKFIILWHQKAGKWLVTRTISFDHHPAQKQ
jgi:ketosteroid isomerase-like protein